MLCSYNRTLSCICTDAHTYCITSPEQEELRTTAFYLGDYKRNLMSMTHFEFLRDIRRTQGIMASHFCYYHH